MTPEPIPDMSYAVAATIGVLCSAMGFAAEILRANILHLRNGRDPHAGAVLFPSLPTIPLLSTGLAWGVDRIAHGLGLWVVATLFLIYLVAWFIQVRKLRTQLRSLAKPSPG